MNLNNVSLTISAVRKAQYPKADLPEIAFAGRSNVGKSSLINKLLNRNSLARVSSKPGKTATINFYNIDDKLNLVDLPGYGFARVSPMEKKKWAQMIDEYGVGYVFASDDADGIVGFLKGLSSNKKQELVLMGNKARELAESKYSEKVLLDRYLEVLG